MLDIQHSPSSVPEVAESPPNIAADPGFFPGKVLRGVDLPPRSLLQRVEQVSGPRARQEAVIFDGTNRVHERDKLGRPDRFIEALVPLLTPSLRAPPGWEAVAHFLVDSAGPRLEAVKEPDPRAGDPEEPCVRLLE